MGKLGDLLDKIALKGLKTIYGRPGDREKLAEWVIGKMKNLNDGYWSDIMDAEQGGFKSNGSHLQSARIQRIAEQARNGIKEYKNELRNLRLSEDLDAARVKCATCLDDWDNFFYYMARYDKSGNLDDLGAATRSYKAVEVGLPEIFEMLDLRSTEP